MSDELGRNSFESELSRLWDTPGFSPGWQGAIRENEIADLAEELFVALITQRYSDGDVPLSDLSDSDYPTLDDVCFMLAERFVNKKHARASGS